MIYGFELTNLKNDKTIAMLPMLTSEHIEQAMRMHNLIDPRDIGIQVIELEKIV